MKILRPTIYSLTQCVLGFSLLAMPLFAEVIPVDLPAPDGKAGAKDKPVKVYILSGQSNMVGFGKLEGAPPFYESAYLSADPAVKACKMPVNNSALMPHGIYLTAEAGSEAGATAHVYKSLNLPDREKAKKVEKVALGTVSAKLPSIDGEHAVIVNGFLDVPYDGVYEVHAGMDESALCVASVDGKEVYKKSEGDAKAALNRIELKSGQRYPISITYAQGGGSAAFWMEKVDMEGMGDLRWTIEKLGRFPYLVDKAGEWTVRNDVILNDAYLGKGSSAPLSAKACGPTFGPELGFGFVMGEFHDEPVLVIKADIGNRSLGWDILPPGSERYTFEGKEYPGYGETVGPDGAIKKPEPTDWYAGKQYDDYTAAIRLVLDNFGERYPEYAEQGFEVAGFVWWQGHKDGPSPAHNARYEMNLVNLIKAWRKEFNAPKAKWAIATVGFDGESMPDFYVKIAEAQKAAADPERHPELAGTVKTIETLPFWRGPEISPKNQNYHYNHNAETYMLTGDALGRAMVELHGGKVVYPPAKVDKSIVAVPMLKELSVEEVSTLKSALSPIVIGKLIPNFVEGSENVPSYLRSGIPLSHIISNKAPDKRTENISSQLDQVIQYYNLVGIDTYDWKPFGPDMQKVEWEYLNFEPKEKITKDAKGNVGDMYREVTLPAGSENWFAADFDAAKAGWLKGKAPFGIKSGKLEPLIPSCTVSHCGCNIVPETLWEKEVLLMKQTFEIPKFKEGHRYRIVVGGAGHGWSGEGFALYLNGKLVSEAKAGYYKSGGAARGAIVFEDIMPEFKDGKATFAVKAFQRQTGHRGKSAEPSGHISVWMEEAMLPPTIK